ncbi:TonB-dependent receptor [Sphingomonas sp. A2-49]|uniref:TonB-dependent receptor n=1 Tax=Sphingomonas sp. A2-49 TaxID=1391375 RepID=UPI0021D3A6E9|nr:TonB-dependent receptor [Sphingomonas sp. A2-49]MCU6453699.1 TonB-dependent receptor [Sphingomonas sp. A2-49]
MTNRANASGRGKLRDLGLGVSVLAMLAGQPALAQTAQDTATPTKPAGDGSQGTTSGTAAVAAGTAATSQDQAGATTGTSGASQDASVTPPDTDRDEIVVTGVRQSLATAQNIKKNSDTVVDAITAQDIGALPDRSVNEALQRVPGVAISRFAAPNDSQHFSVEGSGVVIRGLSYVRGEFNGRDTFAVSGGREIGFNDVPSELIGSVEVFKNLTADLIEGGISGTVNINTRKPFDQDQRLLYLSGSMNWGDMERRGAPSVVGLYSQQWDTAGGSRFGILASASYSQQYARSDSVFLASMLPRYNDDRNGNGVQDAGEGRTINAGTGFSSSLFDTYPVPNGGTGPVYAPVGGGSRTQSFDRKRIGVSAAAQFENAAKTFLLTAQYLRTTGEQNWLEKTIEPNVYYADVTTTFPRAGTTNTYDENGVFTSGSIVKRSGSVFGNRADGSFGELTQFAPNGVFTTFSNRAFYQKATTQDFSLNAKIEPVENLHINLDGQYVKSRSENVDDIVDMATFSGVDIDLRGKVPQITLRPDGRNTADYFGNKASTYFRDAFNNRADNDGEEYSFRGDLQYDLSEDSFLRKLRVGGRYAKRDQTVRTNDYNNWGAVSDTWTGGGPRGFNSLPADQASLFAYNDFYRNQAVQPPATYYIPDNIMRDHAALTNLLRTVTKAGGGNYTPLEDRSGLVDDYFRAGEYYRNKETTWGAYARADFGVDDFGNGMSLSGNIGVRYVRTKDQSFGATTFPQTNTVLPPDNNVDANGAPLPPRYTTITGYCAFSAAQLAANPSNTGRLPVICTVSAAQQNAALAFSNGASVPDNVTQEFGHWLPSLNAKLQVNDKLLFRFAASKAISRPNFGDLRSYSGLSPSGSNVAGSFNFQAQARNPYLRPIEAKQFDLTAEWYFAKVGSLTAAVFYKDLSNIILDNYGYQRTFTNNGQTYDVTVNGPANAPGHGKIKGVELSYQQTYDFLPGVLSGLGTQATFTYVDPSNIPNGVPTNGSADGARPPLDVTGIYANLPLAGLSKYNFNVAAFYDKGGIYTRFAYSWRSKFLLTNRDCCFPFLPVYALGNGQLDGSVFLTVNKNFKIGVEAQNLLDTTTKTVFLLDSKGLTAPRSYFKSDRQFSITTRLTF